MEPSRQGQQSSRDPDALNACPAAAGAGASAEQARAATPIAAAADPIPAWATAAEDFRPPAWLRNRHLQSMLASTAARRGPIARRAAPLVAAQREMLLECGDGVRLQCFRSSPGQGHGTPVVLLHG